MMGSWKSTIGLNLSKMLNYSFVDTDEAIEKSFGRKYLKYLNIKVSQSLESWKVNCLFNKPKKEGM